MKILSAEQIRAADLYSIKNEPVASIDLMERAGRACFEWIVSHTETSKKYVIVCGTGNNGGDGLVIARLLAGKNLSVEVIILRSSFSSSEDFQKNLERIKSPIKIHELTNGNPIQIEKDITLIDAIFGTGLSRGIEGWLGEFIDEMNESGNEIISIDLPSGLFADKHSEGKIINANHTLTFQVPKLAFFFPENGNNVGQFHLLDIGLDKKFISESASEKFFLEEEDIRKEIKPRQQFSHKGSYGHGLLVSGSIGKIGAAVLAARACLRSGIGLLTVHAPKCGYDILQRTVPEAMVENDSNPDYITALEDIDKYSAIGIGPGIGKEQATVKMVSDLLDRSSKPMVIDADALNIISENKELLNKIPENSILTPHPKEFQRLAGEWKNDFERHEMQIAFSKKHKVIVVLKGAYSCISTPDGKTYFNPTGNPGMAKGGSGDALTGIMLAFLSQQYAPGVAAIISVHLHGLAGDFAAEKMGMYSMLPSDLIESIPTAFAQLSQKSEKLNIKPYLK